jgi:hypothetical protein
MRRMILSLLTLFAVSSAQAGVCYTPDATQYFISRFRSDAVYSMLSERDAKLFISWFNTIRRKNSQIVAGVSVMKAEYINQEMLRTQWVNLSIYDEKDCLIHAVGMSRTNFERLKSNLWLTGT